MRYLNTHLGMNVELEKRVMDSMYLAHQIHQQQYFFFSEISELSEVKKSSLQRVLPRLVKRGWIKEGKVSILPEKDWVQFLMKRKITERVGYKVFEYPYFIIGKRVIKKNDGYYKIPGLNIPEGCKRYWKNSAKELRKLRDEFFDTEIERVDLFKRALSRVESHKYKFR